MRCPSPQQPSWREEQTGIRRIASCDLFRRGETIDGHYEVREKIGEGGMGQVFAAWDRALDRRVAIKAARPEHGDALRREARALATLHHRGVVSVYGVGEHEGVPFVVLELVPGGTLEAYLEARRPAGRVEVGEAVAILLGIADALAAVHAVGLAHRDVKPANVMLAPRDRIVLTDFGIFQPESEYGARVHCAGSPYYVAPEALTMTVEPGELYLLDVYSLGVVAYQLLTGAVPYGGRNTLAVVRAHLHEPIPDPGAARPDLPPDLAALVREMLAKDPKARPTSMEAVAWRLRRARGQARIPDAVR